MSTGLPRARGRPGSRASKPPAAVGTSWPPLRHRPERAARPTSRAPPTPARATSRAAERPGRAHRAARTPAPTHPTPARRGRRTAARRASSRTTSPTRRRRQGRAVVGWRAASEAEREAGRAAPGRPAGRACPKDTARGQDLTEVDHADPRATGTAQPGAQEGGRDREGAARPGVPIDSAAFQSVFFTASAGSGRLALVIS